MPREKTFPNEILFDTWEQFYSFELSLITEISNSYKAVCANFVSYFYKFQAYI